MSQIYTQVKRVITYLGPAGKEEEEQQGIELLERIYQHIPSQAWQRILQPGSLERVRHLISDGSTQLEQLPSDLDLPVDELKNKDELLRRYNRQS